MMNCTILSSLLHSIDIVSAVAVTRPRPHPETTRNPATRHKTPQLPRPPPRLLDGAYPPVGLQTPVLYLLA